MGSGGCQGRDGVEDEAGFLVRLERVDGHEEERRDDESHGGAGRAGLREGERDQEGEGKRVNEEPREGGGEVVVPGGDAPVGRGAEDGVVVEAPELGPEGLLPKVRVQGYGDGEGDDEGNEKGADELGDRELAGEKEVEARRGEEEGDFGAEDCGGEDEEGEGYTKAREVGLRGLVWEEVCGREGCCEGVSLGISSFERGLRKKGG